MPARLRAGRVRAAALCALAQLWAALLLPALHAAEHAAGRPHVHGPGGHVHAGIAPGGLADAGWARSGPAFETAGERARRLLAHARAHAQGLPHAHGGPVAAAPVPRRSEFVHGLPSAADLPVDPAAPPAPHGDGAAAHLALAWLRPAPALLPVPAEAARAAAPLTAPVAAIVRLRRSAASPRAPPARVG